MSDGGQLWSVLSTFTAMLHYICACGRVALTFYKLHSFHALRYSGTGLLFLYICYIITIPINLL